MWPIALLLTAPAAAQEGPRAGTEKKANVVLLGNATTKAVRFRFRYSRDEKQSSDECLPGKHILFRDRDQVFLTCDGAEQETLLQRGYLYEFRAGGPDGGPTLERLRLSEVSETKAPSPGEAKELGRLRDELRALRGQRDKTEQLLAKATGEAADLRRALEEASRREQEALALLKQSPRGGARLELPTAGALSARLTKLPTDPDMLTVLAWPSADVYVSEPATKHPAARAYLGKTPLRWKAAPGSYRLLLLPPTAEGRWAAPRGEGVTVPAGSASLTGLDVAVVKEAKAPALVRALWLPPDGAMADRLAGATEGAPDLFAGAEFTRFQIFMTKQLRAADVGLSTGEAKRLHAVLLRTGYLRYDLPRGVLDVEYHPEDKEHVFTAKASEK